MYKVRRNRTFMVQNDTKYGREATEGVKIRTIPLILSAKESKTMARSSLSSASQTHKPDEVPMGSCAKRNISFLYPADADVASLVRQVVCLSGCKV